MDSHHGHVNQKPALTGDPLALAIQTIDMNAFWNQIDPALARYAGFTLVGVVVLALLLHRLKYPRWKVVKTRSHHYRCLTITFPVVADANLTPRADFD